MDKKTHRIFQEGEIFDISSDVDLRAEINEYKIDADDFIKSGSLTDGKWKRFRNVPFFYQAKGMEVPDNLEDKEEFPLLKEDFSEIKNADAHVSFSTILFVVILSNVSYFWGLIWLFVSAVCSIILISIWYSLYNRRNNHFARMKKFEDRVLKFFANESIDTKKLNKIHNSIGNREQRRTDLIFWGAVISALASEVVLIISIRRNESVYLALLLLVISVIISLTIYKFLTEDFYFHEKRENMFFTEVNSLLSGFDFSIDVTEKVGLPKRNFGIYLISAIFTLGLFLFYWIYVICNDPNKHFESHKKWELPLRGFLNNREKRI
jgi:hypothetical protein